MKRELRAYALALPIIAAVTASPSAGAWSDAREGDADGAKVAAPVTNKDVDRAIEKAFAHLQIGQRQDWRWVSPEWEKEYPNALTALATYTLRAIGMPASDWGLRRAVTALQERTKETRTVFARSWTLLLRSTLDPVTFIRKYRPLVGELRL